MNKYATRVLYDQCPTLCHPPDGVRRTVAVKALGLTGFVHHSEHLEFRLALFVYGARPFHSYRSFRAMLMRTQTSPKGLLW
jgi:hypothetical protein